MDTRYNVIESGNTNLKNKTITQNNEVNIVGKTDVKL